MSKKKVCMVRGRNYGRPLTYEERVDRSEKESVYAMVDSYFNQMRFSYWASEIQGINRVRLKKVGDFK